MQRSGANHARQTHAARHHGRMARFAAYRRQHARRYFHAVDIVGSGFFPDQDHRTFFDTFDCLIGVKNRSAHRRARRCVDAVLVILVSVLRDAWSNSGCNN